MTSVGGASQSVVPLPSGKRLGSDFYERPVLEVARDLVGCVLLHDGVGGMIVETEAYHECEPACHAHRGPTPRAKTLFDEPGTAYVYFSYGMHVLLNAVAEPAGVGAAVLIRAIEPIWNIESMCERRNRTALEDLCSGPAKLTQALAVDLAFNSGSLIDGPIEVRREGAEQTAAGRITATRRVGISRAIELPWRFHAVGNRHVSA